MKSEEVLAWKLRLFAAGALFMLLGIALDRSLLVLVSLVVLVVAFLLRFLDPGNRPPPRDPSWDEPEDQP